MDRTPSDRATWQRRREIALAGHLHDDASVRAALEDTDPKVRATALGALARLGVLDFEALQAALEDPSPAVRRHACELATTAGAPSLLACLDDEDPSVVEMAAWASGERQPAEEEAVERLCVLATAANDALVREAAVAALGAIGDERAIEAIIAGLDDKPAIRRRAVIALTPFEGPHVDAALARAREDRDWQTRELARELS